jgi:hypothetical protein
MIFFPCSGDDTVVITDVKFPEILNHGKKNGKTAGKNPGRNMKKKTDFQQ